MMLRSKKEAVTSNLSQSNVDENRTDKVHPITMLAGLQALRDSAWQNAIKYRFDPVLGRAHDEYLQALNGLIKECVA